MTEWKSMRRRVYAVFMDMEKEYNRVSKEVPGHVLKVHDVGSKLYIKQC